MKISQVDRKTADSINRHVEALLSSKISGQPVPRDTASWLTVIGDQLLDKLVAVGLVEVAVTLTLADFLAD